MKKRLDKNHVVKNIGKRLYILHGTKGVKLSKNVVIHLQKCIKYALSKILCKEELEENLRAILPHHFGDHSVYHARFCGFKRNPGEKYIHRSLPYKSALKDDKLIQDLQPIFDQVAARAALYVDLGSSQQCEHANREVTLRVPKSHHYDNSEALDFRVHATAAFINEGRSYISKVNEEAGLSPGNYTQKYADKQFKRQLKVEKRSKFPSTKRMRLQLKQQRNVTQWALQALEEIGLADEIDTEQIPDPVPRGVFKPVTLSSGTPSLVMFDLETTDLIRGRNITSLHVLIAKGIVKHNTAENIAGSGLNLSHLHKIFQRDGEDGLRATFSQKTSDGQPRVSSTKRVLDSVIPKLVEYFEKQYET
ncbi:uncharacterized protein LOC125658698 [Ostrea edulis]|uniref:uncharacterized protein LOC125658698 n=1 Tax=Ostrea edulis TaxID=37623 RepID=UPI0024AE8A03|nr:uncharacterized protein LOC125658698 [Ostrea edulis]